MAHKNNVYNFEELRREKYVRGTEVRQPEACEDQTPPEPTPRQRRPKYRYVPAKTFFLVSLIVLLLACLSTTIISVGFQHIALSGAISDIEYRENHSYGEDRWDAEGSEEYKRAIQARDVVFAESSIFAKISVELGANGFTQLVRLAIYIIALVVFFGCLFISVGIIFPVIFDAIRGKVKFKF